MIDYESAAWKYVNVGAAKTRGIEMFAAAQPFAVLALQANYTYTDTEDEATGLELLRRARHKLGFNANCRFSKNGHANLEINYVGKRADIDYSAWPYARVTLAGYVLLNLATTYDLSGRVRIFVGVKNLGNVKYEEISGYGTPGISAYMGMKFMF